MALFTEGKLFKKAGEGSGGGGGGDQHNLGWYATQSALEEAHPTATAGDWAIVGSTDTVWIWDTDDSEWVDSDQKGQVTSVNGQTGDVVLDLLPTQTGNAGKFLTTDGTDASWSDKPLVNTATKTSNLVISSSSAEGLGNNICIGNNTNINSYGQGQTVIGQASQSGDSYNVIIGRACSSSGQYGVVIGSTCSSTGNNNVLIGSKLAKIASANNAILISASNNIVTNSDSNTFKVANANGNFEIMSADGTIPEARLADTTNAQQGDVLTLDANGDAVWQAGGSGGGLPSQTGNAGKFLTTDGIDASWGNALVNTSTTDYQHSLGILGNAYASLSVAVGYTSSAYKDYCTAIGTGANAYSNYMTAIGRSSGGYSETANYAICIGAEAQISGSAKASIQIGKGTNSTAGTMCVGLSTDGSTWNNYELLSSDGTIPAARHASLPSADGTYVLKLVISGGVPTLSWVAE